LDEIDLYSGTENPEKRPSVDLTDVYAGARVRPVRWLDLGVSYDRRRIFFGKREADAIFPATLEFIDTGPWTTFRADGRVDLPLRCYARGYWDRRLGAGGVIGYGGEAGCDAVGGLPLRLAGGGSATDTRYVSGTSFFGRAGAALGDDVDVTVQYTITFDTYETGGGVSSSSGDKVTRQEPRLSLEWFVTPRVLFYADGSYELGDEARRAMVSAAVTFRF
ncbi:MAG TPA: hypothetical protein VHF22_07320, partial [Planctomycetota bacterium]|nr:hypothetical protein [Planctomycetota bacterium]